MHLTSGDPGAVAAVAEGRAGVQDEGSQLVAIALAAAPLDGPDLRWLDLCAGPGGKAALLAALAAERGAGVVANERLPHRAELVRRALRGADGVLGVVTGDGTRPPWPPGSFDRVLVDAPCTGLGALRRRPEARWRRQPSDLDALVPLQRALLSSALDSVRPGGVVLYATCSPVLAETSGVVSAVLAARPDAVLEDAAALLPGVPRVLRGPLPGNLPALAAPARHRRDVRRALRRVGALHPETTSSRRICSRICVERRTAAGTRRVGEGVETCRYADWAPGPEMRRLELWDLQMRRLEPGTRRCADSSLGPADAPTRAGQSSVRWRR